MLPRAVAGPLAAPPSLRLREPGPVPYVEMIRGICRSIIAMGARRILLLNGHGGNDIPCKAAMREMKSEFEALKDLYIAYGTYWNLAAAEFQAIRDSPAGGMGHACEMETSILLARHESLVAKDQLSRGGRARTRVQDHRHAAGRGVLHDQRVRRVLRDRRHRHARFRYPGKGREVPRSRRPGCVCAFWTSSRSGTFRHAARA